MPLSNFDLSNITKASHSILLIYDADKRMWHGKMQAVLASGVQVFDASDTSSHQTLGKLDSLYRLWLEDQSKTYVV